MAYQDVMRLASDFDFSNRVQYAVTKFATYIQGEAPSADNHALRLSWAILALEDPRALAAAIMPQVLQNATVFGYLDQIADPDLQSAVETIANTQIPTAPTYADLYALAANQMFLRRVQMAVVRFASWLMDESTGTPNHQRRYEWGRQAIVTAAAIAQQIAFAVVRDGNVLNYMAGIGDDELQTAVETQVQRLYF